MSFGNSSDLLEKWPYTYKKKTWKTTQTPWDDFKANFQLNE